MYQTLTEDTGFAAVGYNPVPVPDNRAKMAYEIHRRVHPFSVNAGGPNKDMRRSGGSTGGEKRNLLMVRGISIPVRRLRSIIPPRSLRVKQSKAIVKGTK